MNSIRSAQFGDFIHPESQLPVAIFLAGSCDFNSKAGHKNVSCAQDRHEENLGRLPRGRRKIRNPEHKSFIKIADSCSANLLLSLNARDVSKLNAAKTIGKSCNLDQRFRLPRCRDVTSRGDREASQRSYTGRSVGKTIPYRVAFSGTSATETTASRCRKVSSTVNEYISRPTPSPDSRADLR